jgi:outer membrane protein assembly factor BamB
LTLTPGVVTVTSYEGESAGFKVSAVSSRTFDKPFNAAVVDSKGVVTTEMSLTKVSDLQYTVELHTKAAAAGTYTTDLELRLCEDDPLVCRTPLAGSPWKIPVTLTVATATQAQGRLTLTPATFDLTTYQGEPASFSLRASAVSPFTQGVRAAVFDSTGVLAAPVSMRELTSGQFSADLATASTLGVGEHSGSLELRVCYDDPATCRSPVSGSPWRVPVKVSVKPAINLTTLSTIASLSPWSTYNGTAAQNPYVPASFDPTAFSRRWNQPVSAGMTTSAPVADNGKVFVIRNSASKWELSAISEASGAELWRYDIGAATGPNPLATGNGKVFVRSTGNGGSFLWAFDQASGQLLGKTLINTAPELHQAPTVIGDIVYMGNTAGLEKFNATTSLIEWRTGIQFAGGLWTPAVSGHFAYTVQYDSLVAIDTDNGSTVFRLQDPVIAGTSGQPKSLVVGDNLAIARIGYQLVGIDLQSHARTWTAGGSTVGQHALANGTLYSLADGGMALEARTAATGVLEWKTGWLFENSNGMDKGRMIVSSNLVFISGPSRTVAVDRTTHQVVWTYPFGGELALSDRGVLYIASSSGNLYAINLR